jgi:hypothetical protein
MKPRAQFGRRVKRGRKKGETVSSEEGKLAEIVRQSLELGTAGCPPYFPRTQRVSNSAKQRSTTPLAQKFYTYHGKELKLHAYQRSKPTSSAGNYVTEKTNKSNTAQNHCRKNGWLSGTPSMRFHQAPALLMVCMYIAE